MYRALQRLSRAYKPGFSNAILKLDIASLRPISTFNNEKCITSGEDSWHSTAFSQKITIGCGFANGFATVAASPPGSNLAQEILQADDPHNLKDFIPAVIELDASGLPSVARAAAVRGVRDKGFHEALSKAAVRGLPQLSAGDMCSVVQSLADLGAYSMAFKDATADLVLERLDELSGDMLGTALRAFGSMQYFDADLLEGVVAHVAAHPEKFSAENIADVVYAMSKCGFCHPDLVSVVERAAEILLREADHDSGEAIANIVDAYSRVGCSGEPEVVDALIAKVASSPAAMGGPALAKFITASIRLGYEDSTMFGPLLDALVPKLDSLTPRAIVKLACVLGELGICHRALLDEMTDNVIPARLKEFHSNGLSDLVHALNKLGYYSPEFMEIMGKVNSIEKKE